jgi:uncharacterized membrane protein YoaT (DUF817 family)
MITMRKTKNQQILHRISILPGGKLWVFIIQQGWAALFGGLMLSAIIFTSYVQLPWFARYDWLFLFALLIQAGMLATKLEKPHEVLTILIFHLTGLVMELFKTSAGVQSWSYPGDGLFKLETVPLFSGFMYAAVGSYMARSWRMMQLRYTHYPPRTLTAILAVVIYLNFFTHHFLPDIRVILFGAVLGLFGRTIVYFTPYRKEHRMPLVLAFCLITLFIWLAENIGTFTKTWLYSTQLNGWHMVEVQKLGSWFLLMIISFVLIEFLHYFYIHRIVKSDESKV